ncbi:MAG: E3 ubiquitin protein ligase [Candidatus Heimdallarchaeota archaeon]|nr:E3 ubiquitin protein ligase [Candidatus Heimdallarchaeota archaeon]
MTKRCTNCGIDRTSLYWTFKNSAFCSYRCYAVHSAKLLLLLSSVFAFIFIASMVGMSFSPELDPLLFIPFLVALALGPVPGYITSFLGFIYRRQDKKNPPPRYESSEDETSLSDDVSICSLCSKPINLEEKHSVIEPCGHLFHRDHLAKWISENDNCPECKKPIDKVKLV